jgi:NAD(P)-dependent dehydrogenase (short-subunit alcohol dehydrogenase family)
MSTRVAAVTGANRGIGRAITVALAAGGFTVAASARDRASLAGTVAEAGQAGGTAVPFACDVRDEASVAAMAAGAQALGPVAVVVANAGVAGPTLPLQEITLADWRDTLATDLGPHNIRVNAVCPGPVAGPRMDQVVARQAAIRGITEERARAALTEASPLGRMVEAGEVAQACAYLASDGSAAVTGEDLNVTAGVVMY